MKTQLLKSIFYLLFPLIIWAQNRERDLSLESWSFKKVSDTNWLPAKVPGTVHTDLLQNKIIPDPFFSNNEKELQWIENEDWQYETKFTVSKSELSNENCVLKFEGLDTYAEVFLNGNKILSANNMFRTWKVEVKKFLILGQNKLEITFASAVKKGKEATQKLSYTLPGDEKVFTRKAQYQYGWDWGPRFATAGIWRKVSMQFWNKATFKNISYEQKELTAQKAKVDFHFTIEASSAGAYDIKFGNVPFSRKLKKGINKVAISLDLPNPIFWWPNGMGVAHQYIFDFSLYFKQLKLEEKSIKIGLRTIELVHEKDSIGKSFYFKVNGIPVFMKGANYIPPDSFLPRVSSLDYQAIVKNAAEANMNMLRVWGGGVYADDAFYESCDKNGILVWQDFMFACAMYPGDAAFLENVKQEVVDNVNRLQNHPCMALWCGNNESDEGWHNWGWQKQYNYSVKDSTKIWNDYQKLFHEVIPKTLDSLLSKDKNRYWPSSPSIGWGRKESLTQGDSHYWGVWWGMEPFEVYEKKVGRFMSEYGFQGMPDWKTVQSFGKESELNLDSEAVKNHQKHPTGYKTINEYMARDYQVPKLFEDYSYVSQLLQAEGMKTAIEAHRRDKPNCMGTLFWQLNDCWPVTSWSAVDYYGRWKALQYQVKKSYEKVLISVKEEDNQYKIYLVNDALENLEGSLDIELLDFNGNRLWRSDVVAAVLANSSQVYSAISKKEMTALDLKQAVLSIHFKSEKETASAMYYFVKPKELVLTKPTIQINKLDALTIEVTSDVLAKNVYLSAKEETFFSDNYFDVLPGEKVIITFSKPVGDIKVKTLFDTL